MSGRNLVANLLSLVLLFGGFAALGAWQGDVSWPAVVTATLVLFVASLLIERYLGTRDRDRGDPS